jgi:hypothetical protein
MFKACFRLHACLALCQKGQNAILVAGKLLTAVAGSVSRPFHFLSVSLIRLQLLMERFTTVSPLPLFTMLAPLPVPSVTCSH